MAGRGRGERIRVFSFSFLSRRNEVSVDFASPTTALPGSRGGRGRPPGLPRGPPPRGLRRDGADEGEQEDEQGGATHFWFLVGVLSFSRRGQL